MPANDSTPAAPRSRSGEERLIVYQHSDLLYWWAVWAYGYFCALMTWWHGKSVVLVEGGRPVLIFPRAWLGISFVALTLFVLLFTNARARGLKSLVLFLVIAVVGLLVQLSYGWDQLLGYIPLLLVHMNLAYYIFFSTALLVAWVFSIFLATVRRGREASTVCEWGGPCSACKTSSSSRFVGVTLAIG